MSDMLPLSPKPGNPTPETYAPAPTFRRGVLIAVVIFSVLLVLAYGSNMRELAGAWRTNADYSHGILVIPVALLIA